MLVVMITCYNKLLLNCPILFKGLKTKILAKDVKCEILQIKIFLKDGPNWSLDIVMTLLDIKDSCKVVQPS